MNKDIVGFVQDPSLLVNLCRDVIDHLSANSEDVAVIEQEAQLRTIAKAIEQLENSGVSVPDPLRAEKTRLAARLAVNADAKQGLAQLANEFGNLLKDLRERLRKSTTAPRGKRSKLPTTPPAVLREHILKALKKLGGRARVANVIEEMTLQLEDKLLPGDKVWRETTNEPVWKNNTKWVRFRMTQDGALRQGSPRGIWELVEDSE